MTKGAAVESSSEIENMCTCKTTHRAAVTGFLDLRPNRVRRKNMCSAAWRYATVSRLISRGDWSETAPWLGKSCMLQINRTDQG